jgi:hypothetical protein
MATRRLVPSKHPIVSLPKKIFPHKPHADHIHFVCSYWTNEVAMFFDPLNGLDIDGAWIDMNEPASVCIPLPSRSQKYFNIVTSFASTLAMIHLIKPHSSISLQILPPLHLTPTPQYFNQIQLGD